MWIVNITHNSNTQHSEMWPSFQLFFLAFERTFEIILHSLVSWNLSSLLKLLREIRRATFKIFHLSSKTWQNEVDTSRIDEKLLAHFFSVQQCFLVIVSLIIFILPSALALKWTENKQMSRRPTLALDSVVVCSQNFLMLLSFQTRYDNTKQRFMRT